MSLINQMLSDLEKRGATAPDQAAIRPVTTASERRHYLLPALLGLVAICAAIGLGWWWGTHSRAETEVTALQKSPVEQVMQSTALTTDVLPLPVAGSDVITVDPLPDPLPPPEIKAAGMEPDTVVPSVVEQDTVTAPASAPPVVKAPVAAAAAGVGAEQLHKRITPQQKADIEFQHANDRLREGRIAEAVVGYESALKLYPKHDDARQALVAVLINDKRTVEAEQILQERLRRNPNHPGFAMLLARLQVERNELLPALETLQTSLAYADQLPDYFAMMAAIEQRAGRHNEAVQHYQSALRYVPDSGVWLMGLGLSLQSLQKNQEARTAFLRALESQTLNSQLQAFVRQRLDEL